MFPNWMVQLGEELQKKNHQEGQSLEVAHQQENFLVEVAHIHLQEAGCVVGVHRSLVRSKT